MPATTTPGKKLPARGKNAEFEIVSAKFETFYFFGQFLWILIEITKVRRAQRLVSHRAIRSRASGGRSAPAPHKLHSNTLPLFLPGLIVLETILSRAKWTSAYFHFSQNKSAKTNKTRFRFAWHHIIIHQNISIFVYPCPESIIQALLILPWDLGRTIYVGLSHDDDDGISEFVHVDVLLNRVSRSNTGKFYIELYKPVE